MNLELENYRILITGGASGIGEATVSSMLNEGANVVVADYDSAALATLSEAFKGRKGSLHTIVADLSKLLDCESVVTEAVSLLGGLDTLINNVGAGAVRVFDEITDEHWQQTMNLNFMSYVRTSRAALPALRTSNRNASIINNASDLAKQPEANPIDYAASKAAVLALTKGLSRSEGPKVRVNAIAPGPIWTPFWTKPGGFAETLGAVHKMEPEAAVEHEMKLRQLPLARLGNPQEVADVITFLASPKASFVTGAVWSIDGGSIRSLF